MTLFFTVTIYNYISDFLCSPKGMCYWNECDLVNKQYRFTQFYCANDKTLED